MRKAISIVLAGLWLMLPVEQVLAQAVQQESVSVQQPVQSDGAARRLRVPPLTESAAQLLRTWIAAVVLLAYGIDSACPTGCGGLVGQP